MEWSIGDIGILETDRFSIAYTKMEIDEMKPICIGADFKACKNLFAVDGMA
jgi:hypothetical protein